MNIQSFFAFVIKLSLKSKLNTVRVKVNGVDRHGVPRHLDDQK